jgi:hypothetical protein
MIQPNKLYRDRNEWAVSIGKTRSYETVVEVGVWRGEFSIQMMNALTPKNFYGIDPYKLYDGYTDKPGNEFFSQDRLDSLYEHTSTIISRNGGVLVRDFSSSASQSFEDGSVDLVYLDADHKYEAVMDDISFWWPKVRSGGIFSGHDYIARSHVEEFGVIPAVQEFLLREGIDVFHITGEEYATWWVTK